VSFVNAPSLAEEHSVAFSESSTVVSQEYINLITVRSGGHEVSGTLTSVGTRSEPRIVTVDYHSVEIPPAAAMLVVRNDDRPGMIGIVGHALGEADISISSMAVGPSPASGTAMMVLSTSVATPAHVLDTLRAAPGISDIHVISLN
jgi:D-3-phosphoglycerate dehydrogenase